MDVVFLYLENKFAKMVNAQISYEKYSMANGHWPIG